MSYFTYIRKPEPFHLTITHTHKNGNKRIRINEFVVNITNSITLKEKIQQKSSAKKRHSQKFKSNILLSIR